MMKPWQQTVVTGQTGALVRHVSGLKEAKLRLSRDRKKVDRPLCLEGTGTSVDYEPLRGGDLIPGASQHRFQVAERLDQHCEIHLDGQRKRRAGAEGGEKAGVGPRTSSGRMMIRFPWEAAA